MRVMYSIAANVLERYACSVLKKQNSDQDRWLVQRAQKTLVRRTHQNAVRRRRNFGHRSTVLVNEHNEKSQKSPAPRGVEIELAERLDLEGNFARTVTDLTNVRRAAERRFRLRYLSFKSIKFISPSAALLLASEIDRWKESCAGMVGAEHETWNAEVRQLLCQMGLFELLRIQRPPCEINTINTTFLPFIRGNVDERRRAGALAVQLRKEIERVAGVEILKHLLFDGLTEAITNVCHHAYAHTRKRKRQYRPWWMAGAYSRDTNTVTVSFYDHGRTIPGTLPASEKFERFRKWLGLWDDGKLIRAAMKLGRSSTGEATRGKGLDNFLELIRAHTTSQLRIFSRNGLLIVTNRGNSHLTFKSSILEIPLHGTLIEWQFVPKTATDSPLP